MKSFTYVITDRAGIQVMSLGAKNGDQIQIIAIPWADPAYEAYTDISELPKHI